MEDWPLSVHFTRATGTTRVTHSPAARYCSICEYSSNRSSLMGPTHLEMSVLQGSLLTRQNLAVLDMSSYVALATSEFPGAFLERT